MNRLQASPFAKAEREGKAELYDSVNKLAAESSDSVLLRWRSSATKVRNMVVRICMVWFCCGLGCASDFEWHPSSPDRFALSIDGKRVIFSSPATHGDLVALELDSLKLVPLTSERVFHAWPAFSPDGTMLAYTKRSANGNGFNLYLADSLAKHARRLTKGEFFDLGPSFSADGTRLIFSGLIANGPIA
jgi:tricorn protease-like protein